MYAWFSLYKYEFLLLQFAGVEVSLETQNNLLDLVAFKLGTESAEETLTLEVRVS